MFFTNNYFQTTVNIRLHVYLLKKPRSLMGLIAHLQNSFNQYISAKLYSYQNVGWEKKNNHLLFENCLYLWNTWVLLTQIWFVQNYVEIGLEDLEKAQCHIYIIFDVLLSSFLVEKDPSFEQTWIQSFTPKGALCSIWLKMT